MSDQEVAQAMEEMKKQEALNNAGPRHQERIREQLTLMHSVVDHEVRGNHGGRFGDEAILPEHQDRFAYPRNIS